MYKHLWTKQVFFAIICDAIKQNEFELKNIKKPQFYISIVRGNIRAICDMIKRNESDVGDVVFEILAKTVFKFLCFMLFLALSNPS